MAITHSEDYESVPNGATLTTGNTTFDTFTGTVANLTGTTTDPIHGSTSLLVEAASAAGAIWNAWPGFARDYVVYEVLPTNNTPLAFTWVGGTGKKAEVRFLQSSGAIQIRDFNTAVATSTRTFTTGELFRYEWFCDATSQTLRLFYGSNVDGTTPDEVLSGNATNQTGAPTEARFGPLSLPSGQWRTDSTALGDDWIGPFVPAPAAQARFVFWDGVSEVDVDAFSFDGSVETPIMPEVVI